MKIQSRSVNWLRDVAVLWSRMDADLRQRLFRLGSLEDGKEFHYADCFQVETTTQPNRLRVGVREPYALIWKMARLLPDPIYLLYILHTTRCDSPLGRYQSPPMHFGDVNAFLSEFGEFLSRDGRHDFWIFSPDS